MLSKITTLGSISFLFMILLQKDAYHITVESGYPQILEKILNSSICICILSIALVLCSIAENKIVKVLVLCIHSILYGLSIQIIINDLTFTEQTTFYCITISHPVSLEIKSLYLVSQVNELYSTLFIDPLRLLGYKTFPPFVINSIDMDKLQSLPLGQIHMYAKQVYMENLINLYEEQRDSGFSKAAKIILGSILASIFKNIWDFFN